ncbi:hypothetical protein B0H13DRAFT_1857128 [Mycena leptocephala]|nr:hypothetical protein B0H13DRAFT_1857128 [Mycena leptocephala]
MWSSSANRLACGGRDGRLNIFSLARTQHLKFPSPISALTWDTTSPSLKILFIGMRNGWVDRVTPEPGIQDIVPHRVLKASDGDPIVQITSTRGRLWPSKQAGTTASTETMASSKNQKIFGPLRPYGNRPREFSVVIDWVKQGQTAIKSI